jgi:hypothetical protein
MPKDGSSSDGLGGSQVQIGPRNKTLVNNDKAKPNMENGPEEVAAE